MVPRAAGGGFPGRGLSPQIHKDYTAADFLTYIRSRLFNSDLGLLAAVS
ncbi:hypothetical protein [Methylocapsa palsarum]|uniref:Uncharacterized protein n=1 Tax=Methylocapsa palsarum TaxID=1612308 RepID=A0A1I3XZQ1_9HYPH|nr:hypothetical protein [Methylocapsa palsarum]SFK24531.1 hypothetical protein SAMN05444581_104169 [Methylocapsa palsarum]